jgi:twitching motility protein PilI
MQTPAESVAKPDGTESASMQLAFRIGNIGYLVSMMAVGEIVPLGELATVPWTQPWYRGLSSVRGRFLGVIDLAQFGGGAPTIEPRPQLLVLADPLKSGVALIITRAFGLRNLKNLQFMGELNDPHRPWEVARFRDQDGSILTELDLARLVAFERFRAIAL